MRLTLNANRCHTPVMRKQQNLDRNHHPFHKHNQKHRDLPNRGIQMFNKNLLLDRHPNRDRIQNLGYMHLSTTPLLKKLQLRAPSSEVTAETVISESTIKIEVASR